jgi:hypothetical protein
VVHRLQEALVVSHLFQIYLQLVAVVAQLKMHLQLLEVQVVAVLIIDVEVLEIHLQLVQLKDLLEEIVVQLVEAAVVEVLQKLVKLE